MSSPLGVETKNTDNNPTAPHSKPIICVIFLLVNFAITGNKNAAKAATPLYAAKQTFTQSAPSL